VSPGATCSVGRPPPETADGVPGWVGRAMIFQRRAYPLSRREVLPDEEGFSLARGGGEVTGHFRVRVIHGRELPLSVLRRPARLRPGSPRGGCCPIACFSGPLPRWRPAFASLNAFVASAGRFARKEGMDGGRIDVCPPLENPLGRGAVESRLLS